MHYSTKKFGPFSCAFRQPLAESHCRWVHGYGLTFQVDFAADTLDKNGWVMDFGGLKHLKATYEVMFDHKLIIAAHDPLLPIFKSLHDADGCNLQVLDTVGIEAFARLAYIVATRAVAEQGQEGRVSIVKVECWEHSLNSACYIP